MSVKYAEDNFGVIESKTQPTPAVKAGLMPSGMQSDGYGRKIATDYMVRFDRRGPWRRVYCVCFSNAGSVYCLVNGESYYFRQDENLRLTGEWPKWFKDVKVGQWFDFCGPNPMAVTFWDRCQKVSDRKYRWRNPVRCSLSPGEWLETQVGSVYVETYHVGDNE